MTVTISPTTEPAPATATGPAPERATTGTAATDTEQVVLLDPAGRPTGTAPKASVHHRTTPYHLAFSVHVVGPDDRVLLSRRALTKRTWPGAWSNACCGHPRPGETLRTAVARRLREELGMTLTRLGLALPDFSYRAIMDDGTVEHELCPVLVAETYEEPRPDADEVAEVRWVDWPAVVGRARQRPQSLSPWSVAQIERLAALAPSPRSWLDGHGGHDTETSAGIALDAPVVVPGDDVATDPLAPVRDAVDSLLHDVLTDNHDELTALDAVLGAVGGEVRGLVEAGGKRLRPAFVYWGHRATGAGHDPAVMVPAAAVELLHTFALLHDDVMDRSSTRRGRPTAHEALAAEHGADGLRGDRRRFGASAAILAGDLAFVWADQVFDSTPLPAHVVERARRVYTRMRVEVMAGQYLDLHVADDPCATEEAAARVALLKSGRYTITRPLQIGAALGGGGSELDEALVAYGDALGVAFQLRDDILGLFGDPDETGKSRLDDLREGKRTQLVLRALRLADPTGRRVLERSLGDSGLGEGSARRCREVIVGSGALASVEALVDGHRARALEAVAMLDPPARPALERLAHLVTHRSR